MTTTITNANGFLQSYSKAKILDLLSEGEIGGLVLGARSVYLDETPIQNPDGTFNFPGVRFVTRNGDTIQGHIGGIPAVEAPVGVGVEVTRLTPAVRAFTNTNLNALRVVLEIPSLNRTDRTTGDVLGASVRIRIWVQNNGGQYAMRVDDTISGKAMSRYQRAYTLPLAAGTGPWQVKVERITPDSADAYLQNKTYWASAIEVIDAKMRYPHSALVGIQFDAKQFSNIPRRSYDVKLLKVKVPSNYDPLTKTYTGTWDGTFKVLKEWTDNPAWCFYDLVTNPRYGLGQFVAESQVDKWALYRIGRYCDELVPDGLGGMEPRFVMNVYLNTRVEAFKLVNDLASVFRGMAFWSSGGTISAVQDAPSDPAYLYTPANVIDGTFTYTGTSSRDRHTVALVTWNDPSDFMRQKVEYVEDRDGIARFGIIQTEVAGIGCTSRGQANRVGRWLLFSERMQSEAVQFRVGLDGAIARPGQIIKVADPSRAGVRLGGRLVSATTTTATLDAAVTLDSGQTYTFSALKSDGSVMESTVTTAPGTTTALAFAPALPEAPLAGSLWIVASASVEAQQFRVVSVTEAERNEFEVAAVAHDPGKFAAVEQGLTLEPRSVSALRVIPAPPEGLTVTEALLLAAGRITSRMDVSWRPSPGASSYAVSYQRAGGVLSPERIVTGASVEIAEVQEGAYTVYVVPINAFGQRPTTAAKADYVVLGKTAPPSNVTGYVVTRLKENVAHSWRPVPDLDLDYYEVRQGDAWESAVVVGTTNTTDLQSLSPRGGRFMVKARDTSGNYSSVEAVAILPDISGINVVLVDDDGAGGFNGPKFQTAEIAIRSVIPWQESTTWDAAATWDALISKSGVTVVGPYTWADMTMPWTAYRGAWLFEGAATSERYSAPWNTMTQPWSAYAQSWQTVAGVTEGTYISETVDVGYEVSSLVSIDPVVELLSNVSRTWASYTEPWMAYGNGWTWQGPIGAISAQYDVSTSADGVTWSDWTRFGVGTLRFRYLRIRVSLKTTDPSYRPWLTQLLINIDVPDRVVHLEDVAIPLAGATISFSPAFVGIQTVQCTLQSAASGDRFTVTDKSTSSVTVKVFDSAGAPKVGLVDVDAFGYGERF